ncbi:Gp138 family membrane-puncturing spike protein [Pseudomonas sp. dw_358]|uniref:Gp138 family membrane-puncturing spike protein n=1 Tax=Pseudomonas sp. dw_358 TaxID=2720083 RepID=UPI001BD63EC3|nr:Gp138 family membrane-puncturing spike protein [Pseudomonas sp. dw_358]
MGDRHLDMSNMLDMSFKSGMAKIYTSLPATLITYNPNTQRAQIQLGIKRRQKGVWSDLSVLTDVPVDFPGSKNWAFFHELSNGDEGWAHFSQRCIDEWLNAGGSVQPGSLRMFDKTDACFKPGTRSAKTAFAPMPSVGAGLTNKSGNVSITATDSLIDLKIGSTTIASTSNSITLTAGGQVLVLDATGLHHNGVNVGSTHVHSQPKDSGGNTEADTLVPH